jgi:hypothetical protein
MKGQMRFAESDGERVFGVTNMQSNENSFLTERLPLAIYLHASRKLNFSHCQDGGSDKLQFVFLDPSNLGDQLELEFENGAVCVANSLFASQKFLRRKMSEAQGHLNEKRTNENAFNYR